MAGTSRLTSIDTLRGAVMALMLVDHVREFFFLHRQVADPMAIGEVAPDLFFTRLVSHLCAPVFVLLTGLSAWLYGSQAGRGPAETSRYLATRGAWLIVLELTVVGFAWTFAFPPRIVYLQVIWAIGVSMIALSLLRWLPRPAQALLALAIIAGHNLLDGIHLSSDEPGYAVWAILHDRNLIDLGAGVVARTSYPVLPWIGVMLLGHAMGPMFADGTDPRARQRALLGLGVAALAAFAWLRAWNVYGDHAWATGAHTLATVMAFLNLTKYPPSLLFLLLTLGIGMIVLALAERTPRGRLLAVLGSVPMAFYIGHLYVLHLLYLAALAVFGPNQGTRFGLTQVWQVWALSALVLLAVYPACRGFARIRRTSPGRWTRYV